MSLFSFLKSPEEIKSVKAADFKTIIADKNVQLVDVRTPAEYRGATIEHAQLIDVSASDFTQKAEAMLDKSRPVAVFCHSGVRSMHAARLLLKKDFSDIYNLKGGIMLWK